MNEEKLEAENKRNPGLSFDLFSEYRGMLMGIAILGIMFFHYTCDRDAGGAAIRLELLYKNHIGSSFVEVFLVLSGIGLYYSMKKLSNIKQFYTKRFSRILIPYFIVAVPFWIIKDLILSSNGILKFFKDLLFVSFFESGTHTLWYILLILVCYLIFPAIYQLFESSSDQVTEYMNFICLFTFLTVISLMLQSNHPDLYGNIKMALLRIPAFCGGCLIGKMSYEKRPIRNYVWGIVIVSFGGALLVSGAKTMVAYYLKGLFTFSICLILIVLIKLLSDRLGKIISVPQHILEWIGKYTLELYLLHVCFRNVMKAVGFPMYMIRWEILMWALSFALAVPLHKLTNLIHEKALQKKN